MITFINPWAFLWFLPIALLIVILYGRRMRRYVHETSAGEVWKSSISLLDPRFWWRPWRRLTSLLVQLGITFAFVFCMSEPCLRPPQRMAVVIDCSQSMADALQAQAISSPDNLSGQKLPKSVATDSNPTGDAAQPQSEVRQKLAQMVKNLGYHDRIALIAAENPPKILCRTTSEREKILEALDKYLKKPELTADLKTVQNALDVAKALVVRKTGAQPNPRTENIVLISDGCFPDAKTTFQEPAVHWLPVGKTRESVPITRLGARWNTANQVRQVAVLVEISNFSSKSNSGVLTIGSTKQELTLVPNEKRIVRALISEDECQTLNTAQESESRLESRSESKPALVSDASSEPQASQKSVAVSWDAALNGSAFQTQLLIPKLTRFPVFLVSRSADWLAKLLSEVPAVESVTTVTAVPEKLPANAVLIFDGATPRAIPDARTLVFGPKKDLLPFWKADRQTPVDTPVASVNWDFDSDLWSLVNLAGQQFIADSSLTIGGSDASASPDSVDSVDSAESAKSPGSTKLAAFHTAVLAADAKNQPLAWSIERGDSGSIFVFSCDLSRTDWSTTPGFAALLNNIFRYWSGGVMDPVEAQVFADLDRRIPELNEQTFVLPGEDVIPLWTIIGVLLLAAVVVEWILYQRRWLE